MPSETAMHNQAENERHRISVADSTADHKELASRQQRRRRCVGTTASIAVGARKAWAHVRRHRYWYIALTASTVFLSIFLPVFFLVAIPAIIQQTIASAELPIRAATFEALSPTTALIGLTTELNTPVGISAGLDAFTLELFLPENGTTSNTSTTTNNNNTQPAFATLHVPAHQLRGPTRLSVPPQPAQILDATSLRLLLSRAFASDRTTVGIRGSSTARLGRHLVYPVTLNKQVSLAGLRGLDGARVESIEPVVASSAGGSNGSALGGSLFVPNWSALSLGLGNMTCDVVANGIVVGQTTVEDLRLVPGNQSVAYVSRLDADAVTSRAREVLGALDQEGDLDLLIRGNSSSVDGQRVEYLDDVMSQISISTQLPLCMAMKALPLEAMAKIPPDALLLIPVEELLEC